MGKRSLSGNGYNIEVGLAVDTESGAQQVNKFLEKAEKISVVKTKIEIDGNKYEQTIDKFKTKLGEVLEVTTLNRFEKGWHGIKETVSSTVSTIVTEEEAVKKAIKDEADARAQADKEAERAFQEQIKRLEKEAQEQQKQAELAQKLADKQAKEEARILEKQKQAEAKAIAQAQKEAEKEAKTLERQALAEKKASDNAQRLADKQRMLAVETKRSKNIMKNFIDTFLKMVKFNTINLIYDGIIDGMRQCITITEEFDKAMTEFKKVTDTSNLSLKEYTETLSQLGELTAKTTTEMLQASTEFSKSGFSPEDSAKLAQVATLYQNIADSELSAGESASFIISQMKAFGIEANNAISIIDKVNEVKLLLTSINCVNFWKAKTYYMSC